MNKTCIQHHCHKLCEDSLLARVRTMATTCAGAATAEMGMAVAQNACNRSGCFNFRVDVTPKHCFV